MNTIKNGVNLMDGIANLVNGGNLINLTPHPINIILDNDSDPIVITPSGVVPRVASTATVVAPGFITSTFGDVTDLPDPVPGKLLMLGPW